jgi:mRNA interferase RelE/StbE
MYSVTFLKQAQRTLLKMPRSEAIRIREKIEQIAREPYAKHNNVTKLQNRPGYRLRVGDWRVIYDMQDDELILLVIKIASRGEVYR